MWPAVLAIGAVCFLVLMRLHQDAQRQRRFFGNIADINLDEEKRLGFEFARDDKGASFQDTLHPYSADLDIFGKHSLFRLLNRTRTAEGSTRLADWLRTPAPLETILERQEALTASRGHFEWRQNWQATAMLHENATQHIGALENWLNTPLEAGLKKLLPWKWWSIVTVSLLVAWAAGLLPFWPSAFSLVVHLLVLRRFAKPIQQLTGQTLRIGTTLVAYADMMALTGEAPMTGKWWKAQLETGKEAEKAVRELGTWFNRLDFRANAYFTLFIGIPVLWDLICLDALENWKDRYREQFPDWVDALANIEALNSLVGHAFANPDQVLPEVHWGNTFDIEAVQMGHPLIPAEKRVCNDFSLQGCGQTVLITGSNMSGKSTFLRTVGLNLVLAQAGGVVAAQRLSCSLMQVFTSMRTQDSLEENTSSFYAELKRLKQLITLAEARTDIPVFYLLDEILKGTNSADRHRGAAALIRQLHPMNASGIVSTHDLELGIWGNSRPYVQNFSFQSDLSEGRITFDYRLRPGTCASFNASELMRMMGIKMELHDEK